jgi:D-alanine transaminase
MMSRFAYVSGRYVRHALAAVHIEDRGYQFADGVYEVLLLQRGRVLDAELHLDRWDRSLRELRIAPPMGRAALLRVVGELVRRNRLRDGLIYMQATRGVAKREHAFPANATPTLVVTVRAVPPFPDKVDRWTTTAITRPDERWARCDIKSVSLLPNVLARQAAREAGAGEAILVAPDGIVTEGAATNVWIVDADGVLRTHPLNHAILPGCTRAALLALLKQRGIAVDERAFDLAALRSAREVMLTGATTLVKPVLALDGEPVGEGRPGPVAQLLFSIFRQHIAEMCGN